MALNTFDSVTVEENVTLLVLSGSLSTTVNTEIGKTYTLSIKITHSDAIQRVLGFLGDQEVFDSTD